ncbi:hypothetical protein [Schaalia vaccimaxillae]|uniref:hypothetical protein n=1 Tax=Schaalia vaccimaxillae TaxID=183916 RepID=UPI0003B5E3BC|nr:hypothetical protein [Schaalia vaccimaxillae]
MGAEDEMPLPPDIRNAANEFADELDRVTRAISSTQVASHQTGEVPGWIGEAADAYTDSILKLGQHARELSESFAPAVKAIRQWGTDVGLAIDTTVPRLWEDYRAAEHKYEQSIADLNDEEERLRTTDSPMNQYEYDRRAENIANVRTSAIDKVLQRYKTAMENLDGQAQDAAKAVVAAQNSVVDEGKTSSRAQVGASLFDDIPVIDGQAEWEHAQQVAPRMATRMRDQDLTPEELEEFYNTYGELLNDPYVANALAEILSADEMVQFGFRVATSFVEKPEMREDVLRSLGTTLVLATGGLNTDGAYAQKQAGLEAVRAGLMTGNGQPLSDRTSAFVEEIKTAGRTDYDMRELSPTAYNYSRPDIPGYELISQILGEAGTKNPNLALGPAFFTPNGSGLSVAEDLVLWDSQQLDWVSHPGFRDVNYFFGMDQKTWDPMHSMYMLMDRPGNLDLSTADPALVTADRARLDAVQTFLDSDTPAGMDIDHDREITDADKPMNMTRYLTGWRTGSVFGDYFGFQDGGEQFGRVLDQASNAEPYPDGGFDSEEQRLQWQDRDARATSIAANFMFGYQDALDVNYDQALFFDSDKVDGQDVFGYHNKNLRSWAGLILADHIDGLAMAFDEAGTANGITGGAIDNHSITFDFDMRQRLLGANGFFTDLGFDSPEVNNNGTPDDQSDDFYVAGRAPAYENLAMAAQGAYLEDLEAAVAGTDPTLSINTVTDRWSSAMEALFTSPEDATKQALDALNARNERWQSLIKLGVGAIPVGGVVSEGLEGSVKDLTSYFANQGRDGATAHVLEHFLSTDNNNDAAHVSAETMVQEFMKDSLYQAISTEGDFSTAAQSPTEYSQNLNARRQFTDADGNIIPYHEMTVDQQSAFRDYISRQGASTDYAEASNHVETSVTVARKAHADARIIWNK